MAEDTDKKNVSELNIDNQTYDLIDLEARRMFLKYYDKLHGPYGSITGVLNSSISDQKFLNIPKKYIKENNVYLVYLIGQGANNNGDSDYWAVYLVTRSSNHVIYVPLRVGSKTDNNFGIVFDTDGTGDFSITFKTQNHSGIYGIIRLNTFNYHIYSNWETPGVGRQNSWTNLATRIASQTEADLNLE